jgi:hypothetical protein
MTQELLSRADTPGVALIKRAKPCPRAGVSLHRTEEPFSAEPARGRWSLSFLWQLTMLTLSGVVVVLSIHGLRFQADFNGDLYVAGQRILHGVSPYDISLLRHEAAVFAAGGSFHPVISPRWPAPVLLLGVPFALLPIKVAGVLFMLISIAAVVGALRLLGVRDSRCVLVALISTPTVNGVLLGNISPLILLGVALAWRLRSRYLTTTAISAAVVVAKLYLWPLGIWLLVARGRRSLIVCVLLALLTAFVGWMVIGFAGLAAYPNMLLDVARIGEPRGCSLVALLIYLGFGVGPARFIAFAAAFTILFLSWKLARRGHERHAFGLVLIAALTATPVVWDHYMVLLFVPIALLSPGISWLWFLPALAAFAPAAAVHSYGVWILPVLGGELVLTAALCKPLVPEPAARYWRSIVATAKAAAPS